MITVLALPRFSPQGASSRYRIHRYLPYLEAHGISVKTVPLLGADYLDNIYHGKKPSVSLLWKAYASRISELLRGRRYDLVWIQGESLPWIPGLIESLFLRRNARYVLDYDDAIFHTYDSHRNPVVRWILGGKISRLMRRAALVVAGNEYIADYAQRSGAGCVRLLPTVVDTAKYSIAPLRHTSQLNIGWIGTPRTAHLLAAIQPALKEFCRNKCGRLTLVGSGPIHLDDIPFVVREWSEGSEVAELQQMDVGIMPLSESVPFQKGKCGLKVIQYMACGLPVIGTPVGVNAKLIQNNVTGLQATTHEEWVDALHVMNESAERRRRMGMAGRRLVEEEYSFETAAPRLAEMLREAAEPRVLCNHPDFV